METKSCRRKPALILQGSSGVDVLAQSQPNPRQGSFPTLDAGKSVFKDCLPSGGDGTLQLWFSAPASKMAPASLGHLVLHGAADSACWMSKYSKGGKLGWGQEVGGSSRVGRGRDLVGG